MSDRSGSSDRRAVDPNGWQRSAGWGPVGCHWGERGQRHLLDCQPRRGMANGGERGGEFTGGRVKDGLNGAEAGQKLKQCSCSKRATALVD